MPEFPLVPASRFVRMADELAERGWSVQEQLLPEPLAQALERDCRALWQQDDLTPAHPSSRLETIAAALTQADFPLPTLGAKLNEIRAELLYGRGFGLIRGLPVDEFGKRGAAIAFWAVSRHLSDGVFSQNKTAARDPRHGAARANGPASTLCSGATDGSTTWRTGPYLSTSGWKSAMHSFVGATGA